MSDQDAHSDLEQLARPAIDPPATPGQSPHGCSGSNFSESPATPGQSLCGRSGSDFSESTIDDDVQEGGDADPAEKTERPATNDGELVIAVISGFDLTDDLTSKKRPMDPYVNVKVTRPDQPNKPENLGSTRVIENSFHPEWKTSFKSVHNIRDERTLVTLVLKDRDVVSDQPYAPPHRDELSQPRVCVCARVRAHDRDTVSI